MPKKYKPLTFEEYEALAHHLSLAERQLQIILISLSDHLPKASPARRSLSQLLKKCSDLKRNLDSQLFCDHPNKTTAELTSVFYDRV